MDEFQDYSLIIPPGFLIFRCTFPPNFGQKGHPKETENSSHVKMPHLLSGPVETAMTTTPQEGNTHTHGRTLVQKVSCVSLRKQKNIFSSCPEKLNR